MADTIDPRRAALLVMDYQRRIVPMADDPDALLERAAGAIALMRSRGGHVGYVRVAFTPADIEAVPPTSAMGARVTASSEAFLDDSAATAVHERVAPREGDIVVRKTRVGAFSTTDLDARLRERGIDTLLLAGVSTSGVVLSTVREAADRDYRLVVLADACADPDPDVHAFLTERIFPRQARVVSTGELEALLESSSKQR